MAIVFCPSCKDRVQVLDQHFGKLVRCPRCQKSFAATSSPSLDELVKAAPVTLACPACHQPCTVPAEFRGRNAQCPACKKPFLVPAAAVAPPPEPPLAQPAPEPAAPTGGRPIRFACPRCGIAVEAASDQAGAKMPCPSCGQRLQVPEDPLQQTIVGQVLRVKPAVS